MMFDEIAIVTRFGGESAQSYVDAFEARGLKVHHTMQYELPDFATNTNVLKS
jgi:hypothetical protein